MPATLFVSLSGLTDDVAPAAAELVAELDARGVPLSLLLRPSGPDGPLRAGSPLVDWLHERRRGGDAVVLHGYDHAADPTATGQLVAMTRMARRAEFATLPRHEAGLRLTAARRVLTGLGLRTDAFVPPRWLASPGTVAALCEQGFAVLADENSVRRLDGTTPALRGRVLAVRSRPSTWAGTRTPSPTGEVARAARRGGAVRINVGPADLERADAVLAVVDAALTAGAVPSTYRLPTLARAA